MTKILSPEEAFDVQPGEVSIPIDYNMWNFRFTRNWFRNRNQATWSTYLRPKFGTGQPVRMLQIGVFEGMDSVWDFQNLLTHPDSHMTAVDPWLATTKLEQEVMDLVQERARHNLKPWEHKLKILHGTSQEMLLGMPSNQFDLIVVDGDHNKDAVINDAIHAIRVAKPGAWIVFDDVRNRVPKPDHVQHALDELTSLESDYHKYLKLVWRHRYCNCYEISK